MKQEQIKNLVSQMTLEKKAASAQPASVTYAIFTFSIYIPLALFVVLLI